MIGEIIAIGDELTSGQRLDTNSQWLAQQLGDLGVQVMFHSAVGDELPVMVEVLKIAVARSQVVVCTGGLGPTADDLTRQALAQLARVNLEQDDAALAHIRGIYARRARPMPQRNVVQAMFPAGSNPIPNPHGTAPGIDMPIAVDADRGARIFALPGVPAEMKEMFAGTVAPEILEMIPAAERRVIRHRRIKCFGVGESDLEAMLPDLISREYYPRVGITVSKATITLRISAIEQDEATCWTAMEATIAQIRESLGELIFGDEDDELQHVVARMLAEKEQTLATAESFTGGLLAGWLASLPESTTVFRGGRMLAGEAADTPEVVEQLAQDMRNEMDADFALVIGGSRQLEEDAEIPYALATEDSVITRIARNIGHPEIRQPRVAKAALDLLRKHLISSPQS